MAKGKTIYVKKYDLHRYLRNNGFTILASAGPNGSITGMRKLYWGDNCTIIKSGNTLYKVG